MIIERFKGLTDNYGELFHEVFEEQGLDYQKFEESVFDAVNHYDSGSKDKKVLDIGIGDGETIKPFVKAGWKNLVGIDINSHIIDSAKRNFGDKVKLFELDATNMNLFNVGDFDAIITGVCIHNISISSRKLFWKELLRLSPEIFVAAEKIADSNKKRHMESYDREIAAVKKVYGEKHNLPKVADEWVEHYKVDEEERLTLEEINRELSKIYDIKVTFEMGMGKTIVAIKK